MTNYKYCIALVSDTFLTEVDYPTPLEEKPLEAIGAVNSLN